MYVYMCTLALHTFYCSGACNQCLGCVATATTWLISMHVCVCVCARISTPQSGAFIKQFERFFVTAASALIALAARSRWFVASAALYLRNLRRAEPRCVAQRANDFILCLCMLFNFTSVCVMPYCVQRFFCYSVFSAFL